MPICCARDCCVAPALPLSVEGLPVCCVCGNLAHEECSKWVTTSTINEDICLKCHPACSSCQLEEQQGIQQHNEQVRLHQGQFNDQPFWEDSEGQSVFRSHEVDRVLHALSSQQHKEDACGGKHHEMCEIKLMPKTEQRSGDSFAKLFKCWFCTEPRGGCDFVIRWLRTPTPSGDECRFQIGKSQHGDHKMSIQTKVLASFTSPSKFDKKPMACTIDLSKKIALQADDKTAASRKFSKKKKDWLRKHLPGGDQVNTHEAVHAVTHHKRDSVCAHLREENKLHEKADVAWVCPDCDGRRAP